MKSITLQINTTTITLLINHKYNKTYHFEKHSIKHQNEKYNITINCENDNIINHFERYNCKRL